MEEYKRIEHGKQNVFGFKNPEAYYCHVMDYRVGHSEMRIRLYSGGFYKPSYLFLPGVDYFEGNLKWHGANFRTAPRKQCVDLLMRRERDKTFAEEMADDTYLYLIDTSEGQIKILGGQGEFLTRIEDHQPSNAESLLERIMPSRYDNAPSIVKKYDPITNAYVQADKSSTEHTEDVSVDYVLGLLEKGYTHSDIMALCSWIDSEDIQAALIYARRAISKPSDTE